MDEFCNCCNAKTFKSPTSTPFDKNAGEPTGATPYDKNAGEPGVTPDKNAGEPGITAKPGNDLQKYDWDLVGTYDETIVQLVSIKNKK